MDVLRHLTANLGYADEGSPFSDADRVIYSDIRVKVDLDRRRVPIFVDRPKCLSVDDRQSFRRDAAIGVNHS